VSTRSALRREWRQFRLLSRDSVRRLLDQAVMSRESDPVQFALWGAMLVVTPPLALGVRKLMQFTFLQAVTAANPMITGRILTAERLFFVLYGMLVAGLLAALTWEALYPDRTDQEIVGVLPVRPRTLAAARLGAAVAVGFMVAAAINIPAALLYSVGSMAYETGSLPRVAAAHVVATMSGCAFVFLALVALRGIVGICAGERVANRLAVFLQFVTIVLLLEVFLFLPYVVRRLVAALGAGGASALPPVWFTSLYIWLAEGSERFAPGAAVAGAATGAVIVVVAALSLVSAGWMGRRALHVRASARANPLMVAARALATLLTRDPSVRGMYLFGVASLVRNRRHLLVLARYLGMAIAAAVLGVLGPVARGTFVMSEPRPYLLAIPLVFVFFAIFGLRTAVAVPAEVEANWPFRMATPTIDHVLNATRLLIVSLGIMPIILAWLFVTAAIWPLDVVVRSAVLDLAAGLAVMEVALLGWSTIPLATPHEPAPETLKSRWMWYLLLLLVFAKGGAALQFEAVRSTTLTGGYVAAAAATIVAIRIWRRRWGTRRSPTFEAAPQQIESLNLSEALN
jgi:hypothetical protein